MTGQEPLTPPSSSPTLKDVAHAITVKAAVSSAPIAGPVFSELLQLVVTSPAQQRLDRFLQAVADRLNALGENGMDLQRLASDEGFQDAVASAIDAGRRTQSKERRKRLLSCVESSARLAHAEHKVQLVNQAYVVHMMAVWQAFVEDLAGHVTDIARPPTSDPGARDLVDKRCARFNTPNAKNINRLFKDLIAIPTAFDDADAVWAPKYCALFDLAAVLDKRHKIAHEAWTGSRLDAAVIGTWIDPLFSLGQELERIVVRHARAIAGTLPPI